MKLFRTIFRDPFFWAAAFFVLLPSLFQVSWGLGGRVILASPLMQDAQFKHAVVYVVEHTLDGARGLVLNKPFDKNLPEEIKGFSGPVFWGGPLKDRDSVTVLFFSGRGKPLLKTFGEWREEDPDILTKVGDHPDRYRIFVGFCGWQALQLDVERLKKGWVSEGVRRASVFSRWEAGEKDLWKRTLEESGFYKKTSFAHRIGA